MNGDSHPEPSDCRGVPSGLARPNFGINHVIAYGQSLSDGWEGWPPLSVTPRHDSIMLGRSVRALHEQSTRWEPVGTAEFHRLVATAQLAPGGALLTAQQIAALAPGSAALGETVLEAAVNTWRGRILAASGATASAHRLLASCCGVGGRTLEQLSKGATPELFNRLRDCTKSAKQTAALAGHDYGLTALLFLQGESNSWGLNQGTSDRTTYKSLLRQFYEDFCNDIALGIAGQRTMPGMFLYQTGAAYASDTLSIAQAQLEAALEIPGCFLAAPAYPVTCKGAGHLDANGYRWLGSQFGKVMHYVIGLGLNWQPLHPLHATAAGLVVTVTFHVPAPPLAWGRPFAGHFALDVPDKGFTVLDEAGAAVPIANVELDGPDSIRISLQRLAETPMRLLYADRRHHGRGCLHDSDREVADDHYEFNAASGHYPSADIPGLVDQPYPLMNWCVAFIIPIRRS
jgi:hypothetical protein